MHKRKASHGEERYTAVSHALCGESVIGRGCSTNKAERDAENKRRGHEHGCKNCKLEKQRRQ